MVGTKRHESRQLGVSDKKDISMRSGRVVLDRQLSFANLDCWVGVCSLCYSHTDAHTARAAVRRTYQGSSWLPS